MIFNYLISIEFMDKCVLINMPKTKGLGNPIYKLENKILVNMWTSH